jgi:hypothetical protein
MCGDASLCLQWTSAESLLPRPTQLDRPGCRAVVSTVGPLATCGFGRVANLQVNLLKAAIPEAVHCRQAEQYVFAGLETRSLDPGERSELLSRSSQPMARASANNFDVVSL